MLAIRNFLKTGLVENRKSVTVTWKKCCLFWKKKGDIGVKDLLTVYKALLKKFTWKLMNSSSFVFTFMRLKYLHNIDLLELWSQDLSEPSLGCCSTRSEENWFGQTRRAVVPALGSRGAKKAVALFSCFGCSL